jgi:hypothetical protein
MFDALFQIPRQVLCVMSDSICDVLELGHGRLLGSPGGQFRGQLPPKRRKEGGQSHNHGLATFLLTSEVWVV